ncbi:alpha-ketoglutarate-dependent dioxygenase AlkB [Xanthomonas sp. A2111]|uniref:Alpha-ketoglutarate-dependent dioxygenase AlkB n=1 Tax=Xanthomonas hawaiiensis TaxID=3003247 RepID=A0ABU2I350_9XANT|nr:alpha-ketoglutarate-dependent dioxygenase AlkB [Xanthomonas sp. A2111]MBO9829005.1 alpha-ketoglutarate-dependent dioxygenase AlkB [Xanthomonas sp. A2111]MDS9992574.1 alpha-ketoglutarate-dependent dioxygenase AlkB [Xanthomonas sp. A2111]
MELDLPGADLRWYPEWLDPAAAAALCAQLLREVPWEVHRIRLFGKLVDSPRLSCWIGDADASYRYSGTRFAPHPWPAALLPLRARLAAETGVAFNSVLANRYRDGRDAMGWHSDDERELGPAPVIASLSLGATRRFVLRHRQQPALRQALELTSGGLLLMAGDTQRLYRHALPRTAKPVGERINLTFRRIAPSFSPREKVPRRGA